MLGPSRSQKSSAPQTGPCAWRHAGVLHPTYWEGDRPQGVREDRDRRHTAGTDQETTPRDHKRPATKAGGQLVLHFIQGQAGWLTPQSSDRQLVVQTPCCAIGLM